MKRPKDPVAAARKEYAAARAALDHAIAICEYEAVIASMRQGVNIAAYRVATLLGHIPVRQRDSVECGKCAASGHVGATLTGTIHTEPCR